MYSIKNNHWYKLGLWLILSIALTAAPIKIMPLGDSITEGISDIPINLDQNISNYTGTFTALDDRIAYRGKLWDHLKGAGYNIDFIGSKTSGQNYVSTAGNFDRNHEGWGGQTSKYILNHIDTWLTSNPADIVLLHIGTNDGAKQMPIGSDDDTNQDSNTSVNNVKKILNIIFTKNANTKVFLARIIKAKRIESYSSWRTNDFNDKIEEMVNNHSQSVNIHMVNMEDGANIEYDICGLPYDMNPYYFENNTSDLHPNVNGYEKMAQKWFDEMVASGWLVPPINTLTNHLWSFETLPYEDSIGNSDSVCIGTACPTSVTGQIGNAVHFSATPNKQVLEANVDGYDSNENWSIEFWMNPDDSTSGLTEVVVRHGSLWIGRNNNVLRYDLPGVGGYNGNAGTLTSGWNHIVLTYDASSGESKSYINAVGANPHAHTPTDMTDTFFYIGHYYSMNISSTNYAYNGAVDEVAVYRSALSTTEVLEHYTAGITNPVNYVQDDFSNDGIADILWRAGSTNHLWVMNADGTHTYVNIGAKSSAYSISGLADLNADGITDILWRKDHKNYIWYMHTDGTHTYKKITSKSYNVIAVKDFNNDGIADILWRLGNQNNIWYMNANGTYTYKNIGAKSTLYAIVGTGDLNADGITDILWRKNHKNYIWYMHADGSHTYKKITSKSYNVMAVEDFNNDGIADILWRLDDQNHIWYMNTDGTYTYQNIGTKGITYSIAKTADFNGDGITDILWRKGSSNYLWYMHNDGSHTYKKISGKSTVYSVP